jgi:hypothetical protein
MVLGFPALRLDPHQARPAWARLSGCRSGGADPRHRPLAGGLRKPLRIKIYYILCSSAESTPIIVARPRRRKRFLKHSRGPGKASKNQALSAEFSARLTDHPPSIHRFVHRCGGQLISAVGRPGVRACGVRPSAATSDGLSEIGLQANRSHSDCAATANAAASV